MRLQRKHDVQNRGKREQRTTRNKNTVIHGVGIAAIRNRRTGYRVGKSKKNPEMAMDAADTSAGRSPKRRAAKSDSRPNRMRPAGKRKSPSAMPSGIFHASCTPRQKQNVA